MLHSRLNIEFQKKEKINLSKGEKVEISRRKNRINGKRKEAEGKRGCNHPLTSPLCPTLARSRSIFRSCRSEKDRKKVPQREKGGHPRGCSSACALRGWKSWERPGRVASRLARASASELTNAGRSVDATQGERRCQREGGQGIGYT